jgi:hypothetical protein
MTVRRNKGDFFYQTSLNEQQQEIVQRLFERGLHGNTHAAVLLRLIDESLRNYAEKKATQ